MTQHHGRHHQDSSQPVDLRRYRNRPSVSPVSTSWRRATDMTTSLTGWILRRGEQSEPSRTFRGGVDPDFRVRVVGVDRFDRRDAVR